LSKKFFIYPVKIAIVLVAVFFIYRKVISRPDFDQLISHVRDTMFHPDHTVTLAVLLGMMLVNWTLESAKWKLLLVHVEPLSLIKSMRSVLSGVTVGFFTPNRIGEFAGKIMHLLPGNRIRATLASVVGSANQLLITIVAGGIALMYSVDDMVDESAYVKWTLNILLFIGLFSVTYFYFLLPGVHRIVRKFPSLKRFQLYSRIFEDYHTGDLIRITLYSIGRYLVFTIQFIILLHLFDVNLPVSVLARYIALIYLVMAVVPTIAWAEITVRGSVALYFLSPVSGNDAGILAATSVLWLINMALPAFMGGLTAFYFKFGKSS
jgi:hypothetical protein